MDGKLQMFRSVLRWMQSQDRNGDWLSAEIHEAPYVLKTIKEWSAEQALEVTPRVKRYMAFLEELL